MKLREKDYWLGFNIFPGIGPKRFAHLLKIFGSAKKAWLASKKDLSKTKLPHSIVDKFIDFREKVNLNQEIVRLEKSLIRFIIIEDKEYPENLKKINDPPPLLYIKGRLLPQDKLSLAVIGTRKITPYGIEVTEKLVAELVSFGFTIVSGLARGVDSFSHRVTLGNQGRTIAVLGSGLDRIYPPEHKALAEKIVNLGKGALISQLALGTAPLRGHFPARNRLIAGLSLGVLVTEGATVSGTKITANYAFEQKKKVFAVPGPITSSLSEGPADLIKQGAKLVTKVTDILEEMGSKPILQKNKEKRIIQFSTNQEEQIWQLLTQGKKHVDEIIRQTKFPSAQVLSCLTTMELKGMVKNIGSGNYIIV